MGLVIVHPCVIGRHPELDEQDVREAWECYVRMARRSNDQVIAIGFDGKGRAVEMVAKEAGGDYLVYHAMTPPTVNALRELGMVWR